jgi:hypothetical protein
MPDGNAVYQIINDDLNSVIFDGRFANRPLYLDIEDDLLTALGQSLLINENEVAFTVANAVRQSLDFSGANPFSHHQQRYLSWWLQNRDAAPPFTALLCAFSMAAEKMRSDESYSSNNYYERLFEVLRIDDETEKKSVRNHFYTTRKYWEALNRWLYMKEGTLGRPTAAQVFSHWPNVSYPISQALIREADRTRFGKMFDEFDLLPGETLSATEMGEYLSQWITGIDASTWLKRLWANGDLREKIAQAASLELEAWTGPEKGASGALQRKRCVLYGRASGWLKQELWLMLGVSKVGIEEGSTLLVPSGNANNPSAKSFENCSDGIFLNSSPYEDVLALDPASSISMSSALALGFQADLQGGAAVIARLGRPVIPMERMKNGIGFREVTRISLLGEHIVLCHDAWLEKVKRHIGKFSREGFRCFASGNLPGLPEDWSAFLKVEMLQVPTEVVHENLECLTPMSDASLSIDGGLHIFHQDWHSCGGLEAMGAIGSGEATLELVSINFLTGKDEVISYASAEQCARLTIPTSEEGITGDYEIRLKRGSKIVQRRSVFFHNASKPRAKMTVSSPELSCSPSRATPGGSLSASVNKGGSGSVQGMWVTGVIEGCGTVHDNIPFSGEVPKGHLKYENDNPQYGLKRLDGFSENCAVMGVHRWICEPFEKGDSPRRPMLMTCSVCGSRVLTKNRGKRVDGERRTGKAMAAASTDPVIRVVAEPANDDRYFSSDILFDAACYLGGGRFSRLGKLAAAIGPEPWAEHEFIRNLSSAGHIDIEYDSELVKPVRWWSAPPVCVQISKYTSFLAGYRSKSLISQIEEILDAQGAEFRMLGQDRAPTALFVEGLKMDELAAALSGIKDPYDRAIRFAENPAQAIAQIARPMSEVIAAQPIAYTMQLKDIEQFDPPSGRWRACSFASKPGAYRTTGFGRVYFVIDSQGTSFRAPYELAKVFAAKLVRTRLHSYDPSTKSLISALGCPPPGLLDRALTACSGLLPISEQGILKYENIPEDVARVVLDRLYH